MTISKNIVSLFILRYQNLNIPANQKRYEEHRTELYHKNAELPLPPE